jgi:hypothetical protein
MQLISPYRVARTDSTWPAYPWFMDIAIRPLSRTNQSMQFHPV